MKTLIIAILLFSTLPAEAAPIRINYEATVYESYFKYGWWRPDNSTSYTVIYTPEDYAITGWFEIDLVEPFVTSNLGRLQDEMSQDYYFITEEWLEIADINYNDPVCDFHFLSTRFDYGAISHYFEWFLPDGGVAFESTLAYFDIDRVWLGVPEPAPLALLGLGLVGMVAGRRR